MTTNSQLSTIEPKKKNKNKKQIKQTTRIRTESQQCRSHGGLSAGEREGQREGKGTENKQHKWQVENRQGEVKNSTGNVEAKELTHMIYGHELRGVQNVGGRGCKGWAGIKKRIHTNITTFLPFES